MFAFGPTSRSELTDTCNRERVAAKAASLRPIGALGYAEVVQPVPKAPAGRLILSRKRQYPSGCRAYKVHLCTCYALNHVISVLVVLPRGTVAMPSLNETARVRAPEEERSHVKR